VKERFDVTPTFLVHASHLRHIMHPSARARSCWPRAGRRTRCAHRSDQMQRAATRRWSRMNAVSVVFCSAALRTRDSHPDYATRQHGASWSDELADKAARTARRSRQTAADWGVRGADQRRRELRRVSGRKPTVGSSLQSTGLSR
jgi:hypothetical protein